MRKAFLRLFSVLGILSLLLLTLPASVVMAAYAVVPATIAKNSTFSVSGYGYNAGNFVSLYLSSQDKNVGQKINEDLTVYKYWETTVSGTAEISFTNIALPTSLNQGPGAAEPVHGGTYWLYTAYSPTEITLNQQIVTKNQVLITGFGSITIDIDEGPVGTEVDISGTNFASNSDITVRYDSQDVTNEISGNDRTNSQGSFTCSLEIPPSTAGAHTIRVTDESGNFSEKTFTVEPEITSMTPTSGVVGTSVSISGTGFGRRVDLEVEFGGTVVVPQSGGRTSTDGSFNLTFNVPQRVTGSYTVTVIDEDDNEANAPSQFAVAAQATISPVTSTASPGHVGSQVTITGIGFKPSSPITVTYDGAAMTGGTTTSDASGNFTITVTIPASAKGNHTLAVSDNATPTPNTKSFTFVMESTAPAAPTLIAPATATKADQPVVFDWGDVTDDSGPVKYIWQLSLDANFTTLVTPQKELTTSGFTMTEAEKLASASKDAPYYWRVQAIDSAGNVSAWSSVSNFYTGFSLNLESWVWWVLGGVGVILIIALGFLFGRRSISY